MLEKGIGSLRNPQDNAASERIQFREGLDRVSRVRERSEAAFDANFIGETRD